MGQLLIAIVLCCNLFLLGECQLNKVIRPYKVNANGNTTYLCEFNETVDCLWKDNGTIIKIYSSKFSYVRGNGFHTTNCSIKTSESEKASKLQNMLCIGMQSRVKDITVLENTVKLNCTSKESINCSWKRNNQLIAIKDRYKYNGGHKTNVNDCSITIVNITSIDEGIWECQLKANDNKDGNFIASYHLQRDSINDMFTKDHSYQKATNLPLVSTTATPHKPTSDSLATEKTTATSPSSSDGSPNSLIIPLTVACTAAVFLLAIMICLIKKLKKVKSGFKTYTELEILQGDKKTTDSTTSDNMKMSTFDPNVTAVNTNVVTEVEPQVQPLEMFNEPLMDADAQSRTEVVYTQVIITRKPSTTFLPRDNTIYATINHQPKTQINNKKD
ncbi:hypothetical protein CHUAL_004185 [Chamberlinius hualienensis]